MAPNGTNSGAEPDPPPSALAISASSRQGAPSLSPSRVERGLAGSPRSSGYYGTTPRIQLFGSVPDSAPDDETDTADESATESSRLLPSSASIHMSPRKSPKRHYSLSGYANSPDGRPVRIEGEVNAKEVGTERDPTDDERHEGLRNRTHSVLQVSQLSSGQSGEI